MTRSALIVLALMTSALLQLFVSPGLSVAQKDRNGLSSGLELLELLDLIGTKIPFQSHLSINDSELVKLLNELWPQLDDRVPGPELLDDRVPGPKEKKVFERMYIVKIIVGFLEMLDRLRRAIKKMENPDFKEKLRDFEEKFISRCIAKCHDTQEWLPIFDKMLPIFDGSQCSIDGSQCSIDGSQCSIDNKLEEKFDELQKKCDEFLEELLDTHKFVKQLQNDIKEIKKRETKLKFTILRESKRKMKMKIQELQNRLTSQTEDQLEKMREKMRSEPVSST